MARLNAMLLLYPGGVRNIPRDYPGIANAIKGNCDDGKITPAYSAVIIAGSILANMLRPGLRLGLGHYALRPQARGSN